MMQVDARAFKLMFPSIVQWLYIASMTLLFLKTFNFKFLFNVSDSLFLIISVVLWLLCCTTSQMILRKEDLIKFFLLLLIIFFQIFSNKGEGFVGQIFLLLTMGGLLATSEEVKKKLIKTIINVYGLICLVSLVGWIAVCVFEIKLPYSIIHFQQYKYYDYGIFNICVEGIDFSRYLGMFIEPGYTGVMCVLLLILNGFNFKKKINIVLLVSALATLSLAAYLLLFAYLLIKRGWGKSVRNTIVGVLLALVLIMLIHYFVYDLSWVYDYFFKRRLEGIFTGNITGNRFSSGFNDFFNNTVLDNPLNFLFGLGSVDYIEISNLLHLKSAGYKVYIAQFGIVNTILVLLFYFKCICQQINLSRISLYVVWLLSFIDIAYPTWACFLIYILCFDTYMNKIDDEAK